MVEVEGVILEPCPFCGADPQVIQHNPEENSNYEWEIKCEDCDKIISKSDGKQCGGSCSKVGDELMTVITEWNIRF